MSDEAEDLTEGDRQAIRDGIRAHGALRKIWVLARQAGSVSEAQVAQIIADSMDL